MSTRILSGFIQGAEVDFMSGVITGPLANTHGDADSGPLAVGIEMVPLSAEVDQQALFRGFDRVIQEAKAWPGSKDINTYAVERDGVISAIDTGGGAFLTNFQQLDQNTFELEAAVPSAPIPDLSEDGVIHSGENSHPNFFFEFSGKKLSVHLGKPLAPQEKGHINYAVSYHSKLDTREQVPESSDESDYVEMGLIRHSSGRLLSSEQRLILSLTQAHLTRLLHVEGLVADDVLEGGDSVAIALEMARWYLATPGSSELTFSFEQANGRPGRRAYSEPRPLAKSGDKIIDPRDQTAVPNGADFIIGPVQSQPANLSAFQLCYDRGSFRINQRLRGNSSTRWLPELLALGALIQAESRGGA